MSGCFHWLLKLSETGCSANNRKKQFKEYKSLKLTILAKQEKLFCTNRTITN